MLLVVQLIPWERRLLLSSCEKIASLVRPVDHREDSSECLSGGHVLHLLKYLRWKRDLPTVGQLQDHGWLVFVRVSAA